MVVEDRAVRLARIRDLASSGKAREIRLRAQLSYPEVGTAVGVSHVTILRWERGQRRPTGDAALRYLDLLTRLSTQLGVAPKAEVR